MLLIQEAFLQGISTRKVGRVIGIVTGEPVSAQTGQSLDRMVRQFHQARLRDEWEYLLPGWGELASAANRGKRVQMLVDYGMCRDGHRQLLAFQWSPGESEAA